MGTFSSLMVYVIEEPLWHDFELVAAGQIDKFKMLPVFIEMDGFKYFGKIFLTIFFPKCIHESHYSVRVLTGKFDY